VLQAASTGGAGQGQQRSDEAAGEMKRVQGEWTALVCARSSVFESVVVRSGFLIAMSMECVVSYIPVNSTDVIGVKHCSVFKIVAEATASKTEAVNPSETSVTFHQTISHHIALINVLQNKHDFSDFGFRCCGTCKCITAFRKNRLPLC
jgi:hypothetical protein